MPKNSLLQEKLAMEIIKEHIVQKLAQHKENMFIKQ